MPNLDYPKLYSHYLFFKTRPNGNVEDLRILGHGISYTQTMFIQDM